MRAAFGATALGDAQLEAWLACAALGRAWVAARWSATGWEALDQTSAAPVIPQRAVGGQSALTVAELKAGLARKTSRASVLRACLTGTLRGLAVLDLAGVAPIVPGCASAWYLALPFAELETGLASTALCPLLVWA